MNIQEYEKLKPAAQALGAAFQKVNFLRDIKADYNGLSRVYFPGCDFNNFPICRMVSISLIFLKTIDVSLVNLFKFLKYSIAVLIPC